MASRLFAAGLLIGSALLAWLVIASALAARLLQAVIGLSVLYVGYLAYRGWRLIRASLAASAAGGAWATMIATPRATRSCASAGSRS